MGMLIRLRRIYNFDCSMPIFFNFHILLATFYTIFGTNILIQCPVPVPVFLHVLCFTETQYKMEFKRDKNGRIIILEYLRFSRERINAKRCPGWPRDRGRAPTPGPTLGSCGLPVRRLMPFFCRKKANIRIEIVLKFQSNRSYGSPGI